MDVAGLLVTDASQVAPPHGSAVRSVPEWSDARKLARNSIRKIDPAWSRSVYLRGAAGRVFVRSGQRTLIGKLTRRATSGSSWPSSPARPSSATSETTPRGRCGPPAGRLLSLGSPGTASHWYRRANRPCPRLADRASDRGRRAAGPSAFGAPRRGDCGC
jgi:hypothetical protein